MNPEPCDDLAERVAQALTPAQPRWQPYSRDEQDAQAAACLTRRQEGATIDEIAAKLAISSRTVRKRIERALGLGKPLLATPSPEQTAAQAEQMLKRHLAGAKAETIAREFGVGVNTVYARLALSRRREQGSQTAQQPR
ncbi:sigma factor-like helix-turn-helix DNA-binding protein [Micromonospora sp. NPDC023814]|uniref:sigma factor-like helix-turn-helix DNA-binding protein n=1 Tax=Micromonospora sp. NPDC023814 TaxID=3154596 RepID=UPI0033DF6975